MKDIIPKNNSKILAPAPEDNRHTCKCLNSDICPLDGNCFSTNIVYKATIDSRNSENSETTSVKQCFSKATNLKEHYNNQISSLRLREHSYSTVQTFSPISGCLRTPVNPIDSWSVVPMRQHTPDVPVSVICV